ncbi:hypothetical protein PTET_a3468 [Pseudoalteromonas tetraodonis]|nr:hypothetical protein PTET_a3468 [Pseudoalteromonas tetraodonis]
MCARIVGLARFYTSLTLTLVFSDGNLSIQKPLLKLHSTPL